MINGNSMRIELILCVSLAVDLPLISLCGGPNYRWRLTLTHTIRQGLLF